MKMFSKPFGRWNKSSSSAGRNSKCGKKDIFKINDIYHMNDLIVLVDMLACNL